MIKFLFICFCFFAKIYFSTHDLQWNSQFIHDRFKIKMAKEMRRKLNFINIQVQVLLCLNITCTLH